MEPVIQRSDFSHLDIKVELAKDNLSAKVTVFWEGRNLTIREKYNSETTKDLAEKSIQKTLPKMLLLADIYSLGLKEQSAHTTKITLKGKEVIRLVGKKVEKSYTQIDELLQEKQQKLQQELVNEKIEDEIARKSEKLRKIIDAIERFSPSKIEPKLVTDPVISDEVESAEPAPLGGKVTKELNEKQQSTAKKVMKAALAGLAGLFVIAIAPVLLLTAGAYAAGKFIVDHVRIAHDKKGEHLITASLHTKNREESKKIEAAMTFRNTNIGLIKEITEATLEKNIENPLLHQMFLVRMVLRQLAPIAPEKMNQIISSVERSLNPLQNANDPFDENVKALIAEIGAESTINAKIAATNFKTRLNEFVAVLENLPNIPNDTRQANELVVKKFRELLECEGYQALKYDQSNPAIQFIHRFAASIWTDVKMMEPYREFGQRALARAEELGQLAKPQVEVRTMRNALDASVKSVDNDLFQVRRLPELIMYTVTHPLQTIYSIVSEHGWYSKAISGLLGGYDPHGNLSNNPSLQGKTTMEMGSGKKAFIDSVYGGSPTIDGKDLVVKIAPEFLAVVQAAENNQIDINNRIPGIPDKVFYTNFQDFSREGENSRSVEIMKLNKAFPFSFVGITLSKDSNFYKMKEGEVQWMGAEAMKEEMFGYLTIDKSFTLEDRAIKDATDKGFYFPGDKQKWESILKAVLANAAEMFGDKKATNDAAQAKKYRGAFQEYVYASLQFYLEMQTMQELILQGITEPHLYSQRACKENIDRGGAANAAYLYLRLGLGKLKDMTESQKQQLVVGALHCRALGARDRAILSDRLPQVLDFIEQVTPERFWELQKELPIFNGNQQLDFQPALAV